MSSTRTPAPPAVPPQSPAQPPEPREYTDSVRNAQAEAEAADWRALVDQVQADNRRGAQ